MEFARYLENGGARGSANHSFAGFRLLMERYHGKSAASMEDLSAELMALAVGGHHGLLDVRAFGQVFAIKDAKGVSVGVRGPVSIHQAASISPIEVESL